MMVLRGYAGAVKRLQIIVHDKKLLARFKHMAAKSPKVAEDAMAAAVSYWHHESIFHMPIRATRPERRTKQTTVSSKAPRQRRTGRNMLKTGTRQYVQRVGDHVEGGIISGAHYAIWLAAGTRHIAGGAVMRWKPGQKPVPSWPAKRMCGNPRSVLPIMLPWQREARDKLAEYLAKGLATL